MQLGGGGRGSATGTTDTTTAEAPDGDDSVSMFLSRRVLSFASKHKEYLFFNALDSGVTVYVGSGVRFTCSVNFRIGLAQGEK